MCKIGPFSTVHEHLNRRYVHGHGQRQNDQCTLLYLNIHKTVSFDYENEFINNNNIINYCVFTHNLTRVIALILQYPTNFISVSLF